MDSETFWSIIERSRQESDGDPDEQRELLVDELCRLPEEEIVDFALVYHDHLTKAYRYDIWTAIWLLQGGGYCSEDTFFYFLDFLVAHGREFYYQVLADPESLIDDEDLDENGEWPFDEMHFWESADEAYCIVHGHDPDEDDGPELPVEHSWPDGPTGEAIWKDHKLLRQRFPKLCAHVRFDEWEMESEIEHVLRDAPLSERDEGLSACQISGEDGSDNEHVFSMVEPEFLNVDLEIISAAEPQAVLESFDEHVCVLHSNWVDDDSYLTSLETSADFDGELEVIQEFARVIAMLSEEGQLQWDEAQSIVFDFGYEIPAGMDQVSVDIDPLIMGIIESCGGRARITVYKDQ